jgi:hypothetical protein
VKLPLLSAQIQLPQSCSQSLSVPLRTHGHDDGGGHDHMHDRGCNIVADPCQLSSLDQDPINLQEMMD